MFQIATFGNSYFGWASQVYLVRARLIGHVSIDLCHLDGGVRSSIPLVIVDFTKGYRQ